eukprot:SAG31_NODE_115_length_24128_cov_47.693912_8_plen_67_part_00
MKFGTPEVMKFGTPEVMKFGTPEVMQIFAKMLSQSGVRNSAPVVEDRLRGSSAPTPTLEEARESVG